MATVFSMVTTLYLVNIIMLMCVTTAVFESMTGHLLPFGSHRLADIETAEVDVVPGPRDFWENYVKPRKSVVFRGAAKKSRAYNLWTEEFLIQEYGNLTLRLEAKAEADYRMPIGGLGVLGRDNVSHFIKNYQTMNAYVISQIPQPMEKDVAIPPCLRCGSFAQSLQEVHLFLSAGGGKTLIHRDPYSTIHCVFNGSKDWLIIDRDQTDLIYMSEDSQYELGGYSLVDVDSVDLLEFPKIRDVRYSKVTMNKGDCIFVPGGTWHQVRSRGYMNSAVSIWFSRLYSFDDKGCDVANIDFTSLNNVQVLWRFSGHGTLTQGHMDVHFLRWLLVTSADREGKIDIKEFTRHFFTTHKKTSKSGLLEGSIADRAKKFIEYIDPENTGFISKETVESFSLEKMKEILVKFFDPCDVSNTEDFEYSHIEVKDIKTALSLSLDDMGYFDPKIFLDNYQEIGGTLAKGNEILANLGVNGKTALQGIMEKSDAALQKFHTSSVHDPSFEHKMIKHLSKHEEL